MPSTNSHPTSRPASPDSISDSISDAKAEWSSTASSFQSDETRVYTSFDEISAQIKEHFPEVYNSTSYQKFHNRHIASTVDDSQGKTGSGNDVRRKEPFECADDLSETLASHARTLLKPSKTGLSSKAQNRLVVGLCQLTYQKMADELQDMYRGDPATLTALRSSLDTLCLSPSSTVPREIWEEDAAIIKQMQSGQERCSRWRCLIGNGFCPMCKIGPKSSYWDFCLTQTLASVARLDAKVAGDDGITAASFMPLVVAAHQALLEGQDSREIRLVKLTNAFADMLKFAETTPMSKHLRRRTRQPESVTSSLT